MSTLEPSNPYQAPSASLELGEPNRDRWYVMFRWIPAIFCYVYGVCGLISGVASFVTTAYVGFRFDVDSAPGRLAKMTPTFIHLVAFTMMCGVGVAGWIAAGCWRRKQWLWALLWTIGMFAALGLFALLRKGEGPG